MKLAVVLVCLLLIGCSQVPSSDQPTVEVEDTPDYNIEENLDNILIDESDFVEIGEMV